MGSSAATWRVSSWLRSSTSSTSSTTSDGIARHVEARVRAALYAGITTTTVGARPGSGITSATALSVPGCPPANPLARARPRGRRRPGGAAPPLAPTSGAVRCALVGPLSVPTLPPGAPIGGPHPQTSPRLRPGAHRYDGPSWHLPWRGHERVLQGPARRRRQEAQGAAVARP